MSTHDEGSRPGPDVGSLGEEAVRLLGAAAGWLAQHGAEAQQGVDDVVRQACEGVHRVAEGFEEHLATGAPECTWCPVCRTVHAVRSVSPEVKVHLASAVGSLVKAASALLATVPPPPAAREHRPEPDARVQRITLDDEDDGAGPGGDPDTTGETDDTHPAPASGDRDPETDG